MFIFLHVKFFKIQEAIQQCLKRSNIITKFGGQYLTAVICIQESIPHLDM